MNPHKSRSSVIWNPHKSRSSVIFPFCQYLCIVVALFMVVYSLNSHSLVLYKEVL